MRTTFFRLIIAGAFVLTAGPRAAAGDPEDPPVLRIGDREVRRSEYETYLLGTFGRQKLRRSTTLATAGVFALCCAGGAWLLPAVRSAALFNAGRELPKMEITASVMFCFNTRRVFSASAKTSGSCEMPSASACRRSTSAAAAAASDGVDATAADAVSYTHLRAHET